MSKMIVMDMDGTLLRSDGTCSEKTKKYLNNLKSEGHVIVLATGRCFEEVMTSVDKAFFANYIISHNGSVIYDVLKEKFIFENKIPKDVVMAIASLYGEKTIERISFVTLNKYNRFTLEYHQDSKFVHMISDVNELKNISNDIFNICIRLKQNNYVDILIDEMKIKFKDLDFIVMQDSFGSDKRIEIVSKGVSKSTSIDKLVKLESMDKKDVICFGDGLNDIDMLEYCGVSVAMGNALEEVKNVCKYVTDTNDNDGIIVFLKKYLNNMEEKSNE